MEYIVINESKLKIICEKDDLAPHGLSADSLEYSNADSRKFIECLLQQAKARFGFETAKHRVLIQLFPDSLGGCEIFINKLGELKKDNESRNNIKAAENTENIENIKNIENIENIENIKKSEIEKTEKIQATEKTKGSKKAIEAESISKDTKCRITKKMFFFERLDFLLEACKRLLFLPPCLKSSAFYIDNEGYFLYLEFESNADLDEYGVNTLNEYSFLIEYGEPQSANEKLPYLNEYAKSICKEKAIEILGEI